jgi:hypothetical protein
VANVFNPFSGLGKIEKYIKWAFFRNIPIPGIVKAAIAKFGNRWGKNVRQAVSNQSEMRRAAGALKRSGPNKSLQSIVLPLGKNQSNTVRISGQVKNSKFRTFGAKHGGSRSFVIDVPRDLTKRQMQRSIREQILEAFFEHYEIAQKYKPDFRRRFGDIDIIDIEGV